MQRIKYLFLLIVVINFIQLSAQENDSIDFISDSLNESHEKSEQFQNFSTEQSKISFVGFPLALYTPETSVVIGGGGILTLRSGKENYNLRPNSINLRAFYTFKNQFGFSALPEFYFKNYSRKVWGMLAYQKFPDSFYGIGSDISIEEPESYTPEGYLFTIGASAKIFGNLGLGGWYKLKRTNVLEIEEDGILSGDDFQWTDNGLISGFGPEIDWDERNNIFYPTEGLRLQFRFGYFRNWMGSDFDYDYYYFDYRQYFSLIESHIIAVQFVVESIEGNFPFTEYSRLEQMRGINGSIFKDSKVIFGQAEYRYPIYGKIYGVVFGAFGNVTDEYRNLTVQGMKYSFGLGLRYLIDPEEKINFRLDVGISRFGISPYFQISEAF
ncbi:hypothetical protein MNBD_IGNAVI01-3070 [hydrothermal vent metagenome]|uniref:Bacterial surface antigen (D15) domain-containing protein n=1 Tax=hydrothermal vent metagenome TaxID=652676 RepID=A0A3B1C727_9ZZZZ